MHQLKLAHYHGADRIWVFNVGDLKPCEVPMSFALDLAWNVESITADMLPKYFGDVATREFGPKYANDIATIWHDFDRLVALRKQDHIDVNTFIILKYHEADNVVARWRDLTKRCKALYKNMDEQSRAAFFQLVLHPVKASYLCTKLRVTQYKNQLFAKQRRNTANVMFHKCIELLDKDNALMEEYHSLLDGKWNHILRQPHYGYGPTGAQPTRNFLEGLCYVQTKEDSNPSVGHMGIAVEGIEGVNVGHLNEDSDRTHPSRGWLEAGVRLPFITPYGPQTRYFEVYHRGTKEFSWEANPQYDWIKLSQYHGHQDPKDPDSRVVVTIDWLNVPADFDESVFIEIVGTRDGYEKVRLTVRNSRVAPEFEGFVEESGHLAIEAGNWAQPPYVRLPSVGRQLGGAVTLPNDFDFCNVDDIPFLKYPVYVFSDHKGTTLELQFNMTLETERGSKMEYDIRFDGGEIKTYRLTEDENNDRDYPKAWNKAVMDCVWYRNHGLGDVAPGEHLLEIRLRKTNMVLEKAVMDLGDLRYTYLGPPESQYVKAG